METIRPLILDRMKAHNLTAYRVAEAVAASEGCSPTTVYQYLRGAAEVRSGTLAAILDAVGLAVAPLRDWNPPASEPAVAPADPPPAPKATKRKPAKRKK